MSHNTREMRPITRRQLIGTGLAGAAAACVGTRALASSGADKPFGPFRVGLQSYSLRAFDLEHALDMTRKLGIHYWEAIGSHIPMTADGARIAGFLDALHDAQVTLDSWGVQSFTKDERDARAVFEFAHRMGIRCISADPSADSLPILDKLTAQYRIDIGIHNHGPGARYGTIAQMQTAIKDYRPAIGICLDTGHLMRSGEDPVDAVKAFGPRLHSLHLKDIKGRDTFTILGQGDMNLIGLLKELIRMKFKGLVALEYEENEKDPGRDISQCLQALQDAIGKAVGRSR